MLHRARTISWFGVASLCAYVLSWSLRAHAQDLEAARRHLKLGVTLFQERDYETALIEFEASFRELPSSSALQNIALCQTKLFRYVDALTTLETLQARFGSTLSEQDARQVAEAHRNISLLVGTLTLRVSPHDAAVKIDGRPYPPGERAGGVRLKSNEYTIEVAAPFHVPAKQVIKIAGGERKVVEIALARAVGTLTVRVDDEEAAIAIDGVPLAYGEWTGEVLAGEHKLLIYKQGHEPRSTDIRMTSGDRIVLQLPVGAPNVDVAAPGYDLVGLPYLHGRNRYPFDPVVGWYGLVTASNLAVLRSPDGFEAEDDADVTGGSFGLRGGYRFGDNLCLEGLFDTGAQSVAGTRNDSPETYDLTTRRFGGNVRVLLGGKRLRFSGTFGVGAVWHRLELDGRTYSGTNSFFGMEAGPQLNVGHVLLEGVAQGLLEGANNVAAGDTRIYTERTVLPQVGIGLRVGFSQWGTW